VDPSVQTLLLWIQTRHKQASLVRDLRHEGIVLCATIRQHPGSQPKVMDDDHVGRELLGDVATESIEGIEGGESFGGHHSLFVGTRIGWEGFVGGRRSGGFVVG